MKRKFALLLAAVISFSLAPVTVKANTTNEPIDIVTTTGNTVLLEDGVLGVQNTPNTASDKGSNEAEFFMDGSDLIIKFTTSPKDTDNIELGLSLTNSEWFFRSIAAVDDYKNLDVSSAGALIPSGVDDDDFKTSNKANKSADFRGVNSTSVTATYDVKKGLFLPESGSDGKYGVYYRAEVRDVDRDLIELPYELIIPYSNKSNATLKVLEGVNLEKALYASYTIRIPLVTKVKEEGDCQIKLNPGYNSGISSQTLKFATAVKADTTTTVKDVAISRDIFEPGDVVIQENRVGTIRPGAIIKLRLPYYYSFIDVEKMINETDSSKPQIKVGLEGFAWNSSSGSYGPGVGDFISSNRGTHVGEPELEVVEHDFNIFYKESTTYGDKLQGTGYTYEISNNELWIKLSDDFQPSKTLPGIIYISGLKFAATDEAPMPAPGQTDDIKLHISGDKITEQDVLIGQRVDWAVTLKTTGDIPTLVSGRYIGPSRHGNDANDATHKTAHVVLYESTPNAWWATRETILYLPPTDNSKVKGAKFRKVKVTKADGFDDVTEADLTGGHDYSSFYPELDGVDDGVFLNDGKSYSHLSINENVITLRSLGINTNSKATLEFDLWVSVELGFGEQTGDLKLAVDPKTTSFVGYSDSLPSTVIAHVVDPIKVTTKVSDIKIGYQFQQTADIQIDENGAGYLLKDKTVKVDVTDMITDDIIFATDTKIAVTKGDLKIKNVTTSGQGGFTSQTNSWLGGNSVGSSLSFDIDRVSTTASTITVSNVGVKTNRSIPLTNYESYAAIVWGTAIAENYGLKDDDGRVWKAGFNTAGVSEPYINVVSPADDQTGILTQEVRVPIGESYYIVNGKSFSFDGKAYISTYSNSTMIPLRALSNAFGLDNDSQILWDDANKTATIFAPTRTIQFTLNKPTMIINGASITMLSPDGLLVVPEIRDDRMYIPFRHLGVAFGVPVDWDVDTQTAIFNKGANTNSNAAANNAEPTPTPLPNPSGPAVA
ncbi:MAG: copper amine oxidase N-terminal domain-containing protein [Clostridiales bacterium]|nr:copper amine oxidase N-terminal domain-containing protein [Clostridiales bacterium]